MASAASEQQAKGSQLRRLLFGAKQADKLGDVHKSQALWFQLNAFLEAESSVSEESDWHTQRLQGCCHQQLISLLNHPVAIQQTDQSKSSILQAAGCPEEFAFCNPEGFDLTAALKEQDFFRDLLSLEPPHSSEEAGSLRLPSSFQQHVASGQQHSAALQTQSALHVIQPPNQTTHTQAPSRRMQERNDRAEAIPQQPPPHSAPSKRRRAISPPQVAARKEQFQHQRVDREAGGEPSREHHAAGFAGGQEKERWASNPAAARPPLLSRNSNLSSLSSEEEGALNDQDFGTGGFKTARTVLAADLRKKGQGFNAREYTSGSMFPDSQSVFNGGRQGGARGAASNGARGGASSGARPVLSGLRKPPGAQPPGGARGAFVPPFVKKALDGPTGEEQQGPLSKKTIDMLAGLDGELPEALQKLDPNIVELVCNEILDQRAGVQWEDIAGQGDAKRLVQELVVWPMLNPHLFQGARAPPKGLLLFGPPGTGKTLIGRAIASNIRATFFNISAGSLTSKWIGEGEKMVRALFAVAAALQPAVIFIDEIDSVLSARKSEGEHEASRRLKTELLVQMEGCDPSSANCRVLLVGATNRPEELDEAARRRMPKQLYIPLPCDAARESMLRRQLGPSCGVRAELSDADLARIVARTAGYSGSDMRNLIQEACQGPVRDAVAHHGAAVADISEADLRPVVVRDFQIAARAQRASVEPAEITRYQEYDAKHGARYCSPEEAAGAMDEDDW